MDESLSKRLPPDHRHRTGPLPEPASGVADEHLALLTPAGAQDRLYRWHDLFADGVHALFVVRGGEADLSALLFRSGQYSPEVARSWLREHGFDVLAFVEGPRDTAAP